MLFFLLVKLKRFKFCRFLLVNIVIYAMQLMIVCLKLESLYRYEKDEF